MTGSRMQKHLNFPRSGLADMAGVNSSNQGDYGNRGAIRSRGSALLPVAFCLCSLLPTFPSSSQDISLPLRGSGASGSESQAQLYDRARQLMEQKDFPGAARIYEQILRSHPNSFEALSNLGVADSKMGKYAPAATAYHQALRLQPKSFPLLLNLGLCYFKSGDSGSALKPLERAVAVQPENFQARSLLAMSYYSEKKFTPASREFEKLIAVQPDNSTLQYLLAESYLWSGQNQQLLDF